MPRAVCCQGATLRALISALVLVQCALILLYWDATRGGTGSARPLRLQAKASNEHLHAQAHSAHIPEAAARHFRESYDDVTSPGEKSGKLSLLGKSAEGANRKSPAEGHYGKDGTQDTGKGELISPETDLLLFKPSTKRKYPEQNKQLDQNVLPNEEQSSVIEEKSGRAEIHNDTRLSNDTQLSNDTPHLSNETWHLSNDTNSQRLRLEPSTDSTLYYRPAQYHRKPVSTHALTDNRTDAVTLSTSSARSSQRPLSGAVRSKFSPKAVIQDGGAVFLTLHPQSSAAGSERATRKDVLGDVSVTSPTLQNGHQDGGWHSTSLLPTQPASVPTTTRGTTSTNATTTTTTTTTATTTTTTASPTTRPSVRLPRRKAVYPTYDRPMPPDPYSQSINSSDAMFTAPSHDQVQHLVPGLPLVFHLPRGADVFRRYFRSSGSASCFTEGTATSGTSSTPGGAGMSSPGGAGEGAGARHEGCLCRRGWHGRQCSIPEGVFSSTGARFVDALKPRNVSRRVISALAFNVEFELLEARLQELDDVVDVFIILESNYTNYGDPKPLLLLQRLSEGYLKEFHHKMVYLFRGRIPQGGREDGWIVDQHMRMYIGQEGMSRIFNATPDDLFLYTDADEIPSREAILFLRIHDGFSEPVGVALRWSVFGFFWKQFEATRVVIGCTVGMFRYVFNNDAYQLRSTDYQTQASGRLHAYIASGAFIYDWYMGDNGALAGWHCSWCLPPERIRVKLTSAINADFPRWGDFPEKLELPYLRSLIKTGTWFDDKSRFGMLVNWQAEDQFAPRYMLNHAEKYSYLLDLDET